MNRFSNARLKDIVSHFTHSAYNDSGEIEGREIQDMATELLLLRTECAARREQERRRLSGTDAEYYKAHDAVMAATAATDAAGFSPEGTA